MISLNQLFEISDPRDSPTPDNKINNQFIIQEHHADRAGVHWDVRLGHNGVLVSWATKKLPDIISGQSKKIMLFQTQDHEPDWINFAGKIEDGYGKGEVKIYDSGTFDLLTWKDNHISVIFHGKKLVGQYNFILYKNEKEKIKGQQWLFFKSK